jgi:hypothetical protein
VETDHVIKYGCFKTGNEINSDKNEFLFQQNKISVIKIQVG